MRRTRRSTASTSIRPSAQQPGILANLHIDPAEISVAEAQASRFSQVCRVLRADVPAAHLHAIVDTRRRHRADALKAYNGVAAAWDDYLAHYNDGRGVVVIGHSQGAAMLIALLAHAGRRRPVGPPASWSRRSSSAGTSRSRSARSVGGSFQNIPACRSSTPDRLCRSPTRRSTSSLRRTASSDGRARG